MVWSLTFQPVIVDLDREGGDEEIAEVEMDAGLVDRGGVPRGVGALVLQRDAGGVQFARADVEVERGDLRLGVQLGLEVVDEALLEAGDFPGDEADRRRGSGRGGR